MSKVAIEFIGGPVVRMIDSYCWSAENGFVQDVDVETAANLITYPIAEQFRVKPGQPKPTKAVISTLARLLGSEVAETEALFTGVPAAVPVPELTDLPGLSEARAAELAEKGVGSVADLATLNEEGVKTLASQVGASKGEIESWVANAAAKL